MLKSIISITSIIFCSLGVQAQYLKKQINTYDANLVKYLINKKILVKTDTSQDIKLNQDTDIYSNIISNIQSEKSINSDNCGGNGTGGL